MTTQTHTPGPWDCEVRSYAGVKWDGIIRSQRNRNPICSVFFAGYMAKEATANAHLIAAAPDLYAAILNSDDAHWTTAMRAAMAKVEGR